MVSRKLKQFYLAATTCGLLICVGLEITGNLKEMKAKESSDIIGDEAKVWRNNDQYIFLNVSQEVVKGRKQKVVIILSNQRSGSSFVGDFFAHNPNFFYLFEPLHPYGTSCTKLLNEKLELLKNLSRCEFSSQKEGYANAYSSSGASHDECLRNRVCFLHKQKATLERYIKVCESRRILLYRSDKTLHSMSCAGNPIDLGLWSLLCRSSTTLVFKILRICSVEALEGIDDYLASLGSELYVIELVRDPRAIVNSALKLELKLTKLNDRLDAVCGRFHANTIYSKRQENISGHGIVSGGRYLRVRFEDIAEDPVSAAGKFYGFIGETVPVEVKLWLEKSTVGSLPIVQELRRKLDRESLLPEEMIKLQKEISRITRDGNSPYGTTRNSSGIPLKWRKTLPIGVVKMIQRKCGNVMTKMGYKVVQSREEKMNFGIKLW